MKKYKFDLIAEDLTQQSSNFIGSQTGQGQGTQRPKKVSIMDLLKVQDDLQKRSETAPGALPYPLTTSVFDKFVESFTAINDIKSILKQTVNNPVISTDDENKQAVQKMYKKLEKIQVLIKMCGEDLDKLIPQ